MAIFKQWSILVVLSFLAIFFKQELLWLFHGLAYVYQHIGSGVDSLFPQNPWIKLAVLSILLLMITLLVSAIVGGVGCIFKKSFKQWFVPCAWISWVVLVVTVILQGT
jgi:hypothetical protein